MFCDMIPYDIIYDCKKVLDLNVGSGFGFDVGVTFPSSPRPQHSSDLQGVQLIGDLKFALVVSLCMNGCLSLCYP